MKDGLNRDREVKDTHTRLKPMISAFIHHDVDSTRAYTRLTWALDTGITAKG
jgi:hypothetical protein